MAADKFDDPEEQATYDGRQSEISADRKVDAAGENDEVLSERDDRNDRRLSEDISDVRRIEKHWRRDAHDGDQDRENNERTGAKKTQP